MRAMLLQAPRQPLRTADLAVPKPAVTQVLVKVAACAVCRTDLHVVDGELPNPKLPLVPGHEIVGVVVGKGERACRFNDGDRVGIPWLAWTCGECSFCRAGRENLCDRARFTGYTVDGGYAEFAVADERFCFPIPPGYSDAEAAPLLCAGLIGYRALARTGSARRWAFMALARRLISSPRSPNSRAAKFSPSRGAAMGKPGSLPSHWERFGPAIPKPPRRSPWMPPSSSRPSAAWSRWP